jgi:protein involved in polysaccharide export with SLBB domain
MFNRLLAGTLLILGLLLALSLMPPRPAPAAATATAPATTKSFTIAPGNWLHISVFELVTPGMYYTADIGVDDLGNIALPNLGTLHVADLTPDQAQDKIVEKALYPYHGTYRGPGPEVSVQIKTPPQSRPSTSTTTPATNKSATIAPGHWLSVSIFELVMPGESHDAEVRVNELGNIKLPNFGTIHVADLTPAQARDKIIQKLLDIVGTMTSIPKSPAGEGPKVSVQIAKADPPFAAGVLPKIAPVDALRIEVYEWTSPGRFYSIDRQVNEQGDIRLRNLGILRVTGLTTDEIEDKIARQAVADGFLMPKSPTHAGPQVIVTHLKKAAPGERPATIRSGDVLEIDAFFGPDFGKPLSGGVTVGKTGDITLGDLGTLRAEGLTPFQLEDQIIKKALSTGNVPADTVARLDRQVSVTIFARTAATTPARVP